MSGLRLMIEQIADAQPTAVSRIYELVRYTGTVSLPMGTTWITVDPYYGRVWVGSDDCGDAVEEETVLAELERRLLAFDKRIGRARDECAKATFDEPMDHILPKRRTRCVYGGLRERVG